MARQAKRQDTPARKNKGGRPVNPKYEEELGVAGTPEEVAFAIMQGPPKEEQEWRYLKEDDGG